MQEVRLLLVGSPLSPGRSGEPYTQAGGSGNSTSGKVARLIVGEVLNSGSAIVLEDLPKTHQSTWLGT